MAVPPNNNATEQARLTREGRLLTQDDIEIQRRLRDSTFGITEELKEQFGIKSRINERDRQALNLSRQITNAITESTRELRRSGKLESQLTKEKRLAAKVQQQIFDSAVDITKTTGEQLRRLKAVANIYGVNNEVFLKYLELLPKEERHALSMLILGEKELENLKFSEERLHEELKVRGEINKTLGLAGALTDNLKNIGLRAFGGLGINLGVFEEGLADAKEQSQNLAESFASIDKIAKELSGVDLEVALKGDAGLQKRINAAAEAYVMASDKAEDFANNLEQIRQKEEEVKEIRARLAELDTLRNKNGKLIGGRVNEEKRLKKQLRANLRETKNLEKAQAGIVNKQFEAAAATGLFGRRLKVIGQLFPGIKEAIKQGIIDPFTVGIFSFQNLVKTFKEVNAVQVELSRTTGQTVSASSQLELSFVTLTDILKVANELTKEIGRNAMNIFPDSLLHDVAEFEKMLGLSAKEAGMLGIIAQSTNKTMDGVGDSIVSTVSSLNLANRSAVSQGVILKDVANVSADIAVSLGNNPKAIAEAAFEARRLGIELNKLDSIASSLLDFESSIESELEAQLLTGRSINLAKARELALTNDLKGVGEEIFSNTVQIQEFSDMNRIAQEGLAKALGMSREELGRIAYLRALDAGMTEKQASEAAGVTFQDMKRLEINKQLEASMQKISQALVGPAAVLATMAENSWLLYGAITAVAGLSLTKFILQMAALAGTSIAASSALTLGLGTAAIVAAIVGITAAASKSKRELTRVDDGIIDPQGGVVVSGPKGSIQLNKDDYVMASTNPPTMNRQPMSNEFLSSFNEIKKTNKDLTEKFDRLISIVEKGGTVNIDGRYAGEALVLGSYNSG